MRKFFMIMAAIAALTMSAHTVEQKPLDNTYVTVKGGVTALMHPNHNGYNAYENWGHTLEAATGLEVGKWITPNWGASLEGINGWTNGSKFGVFQDNYAVNYVTVAALGKYRFMPMNKFNLALAAGPEWIHGFKKNVADANDLGMKMKIEFNYNLTEKFALQATPELNYNFTRVAGNQPRFDSRNAWYGLMLGITYKIGNNFSNCLYTYTQSDIDKLNAEINDLRARQPEVIEKIVEVEKVVTKNSTVDEFVVFFDKNSSELSNEAKMTLNKVTGKVVIKAGASEEGTITRNNILSCERAESVATYLRKRGVTVMNAKGIGVTGSRAAIVTIK